MLEIGVIFGLGSAAAWGAGDFVGGLAARRSGAIAVAAGATVVGFALLLLLLAVVRPAIPPAEVIFLGAVAGAAGGLGLAALYRGLSLGSMGLVAAISGVGSALLPLIAGVWLAGDAIGLLQWVGVAAALAAGAAASGATLRGVKAAALSMAVVAAIGFGLWYVILDRAAETHELWALVASRGASSIIVGGLALARGGRAACDRHGDWCWLRERWTSVAMPASSWPAERCRLASPRPCPASIQSPPCCWPAA